MNSYKKDGYSSEKRKKELASLSLKEGRNSAYRNKLTTALKILMSNVGNGLPDEQWLLMCRNLIFIQLKAEMELPIFNGKRPLYDAILDVERGRVDFLTVEFEDISHE